jgi:hypothetical protein
MFATMDWLTEEPDPIPIGTRLLVTGSLFVLGGTIWLGGFLFGRWRTPKKDGIIDRR